MSKFSERFRQLKEEKNGMTLKELSMQLDITVPNLSYYMKGREPNYDTLIKIADYFNVTVDWLIGRTDTRDPESLNTIEMVENNLIATKHCKKITNKSRENYLQIQAILINILNTVYLIYNILGDDCSSLLHKQFSMMSLSFSHGIREYLYVLSKGKNSTTKDRILKFVQNTDLISDVTHQLTLSSSYLYVACLCAYFDDIPQNDRDTLLEIMNFTATRFSEKYPDEKINEMITKMNNLHNNE